MALDVEKLQRRLEGSREDLVLPIHRERKIRSESLQRSRTPLWSYWVDVQEFKLSEERRLTVIGPYKM